MVLLQVDHLTIDYETRKGIVRAVNDVSFMVEKGETMGLVGESGSGKSTLGFALVRLVPSPGVITDGRITLEKEDILSLREKEMRLIRGYKVAFIFQNPMTSLNPVKKIGDHFVEFLRTHKHKMGRKEALEYAKKTSDELGIAFIFQNPMTSLNPVKKIGDHFVEFLRARGPQISKREALIRTRSILEELAIPNERINDYPHQFSGGMRQRIMIGLAIAFNPSLVIADEPTTALDVIVQDKILDLLRDLSRTRDMGLILITHDLSIVLERCDKIFVMYAGHQVEYGRSGELYENPKHPYTQGLLHSIPNVELADQKLLAIPGSPPDLLNMPKGCPFWPRCPHVMDVCQIKEPPVTRLKGGHLVKCFLYGGTKA